MSPGQFLESTTSSWYYWTLKLFVATYKSSGLGAKLCVAFILFSFWKKLWRFKSQKLHVFCWTNLWNLIKAEQNREWKIQHTILEKWGLCLSSHKIHKLKVKLQRVGARISIYKVLNTFSIYKYFYILKKKKKKTSYTFVAFFRNCEKVLVDP